MSKELAERLERWLAMSGMSYGPSGDTVREAIAALRSEPVAWVDGYPSKPYANEWFIAETAWGDRVVLTALPEEYTYDFKTADNTYIKADKIKRWIQFPDSEYAAPSRETDQRESSEPATGGSQSLGSNPAPSGRQKHQPAKSLRVDRVCPRCRQETRAYADTHGRRNQLECASCGHVWKGRVRAEERA